ncbi:D-alanyl-D-alanine carboxypeptidase family protein [Paraburkholderia azotifigens]|uniref:D-alanyl-D-alanine carboxypeptidase family protein n=1 Tax=Paraburkholderia azotifigens TaxID=2057004 RepID=UPI003182B193
MRAFHPSMQLFAFPAAPNTGCVHSARSYHNLFTTLQTLTSRLSNSLFLLSLTATGIASCLSAPGASAAALPRHDIHAASWMLVDGESGQVLVEHNADAERQPASLTKLMTAYIALGALKRGSVRWDEKVAVDAADIGEVGGDEARMHLVPGQQVPARDLVQGLIAASANDAALVLARRVGGSPAGFEQLMNDTARKLGMAHTHFSTPSGITTPGNYSTARDLSTLALRLTKDFPEYYTFSSEQHFAYGKFEKRNKNWLLAKDSSVDGMKTGHTQAAGYCIVATAKRKQTSPPMMRRVFAVILGAPTANDRITGAGSLLNYAFSTYKDYPVTDDAGHHVVTRMAEPKLVQAGNR